MNEQYLHKTDSADEVNGMKNINFNFLIKLTLIILVFSLQIYATNYYVKNDGNDAADGLSDATAWKTLAKVNSSKFQPGDNIYFKRGDVWDSYVWIKTSGTAEAPITIGAYGTGAKPLFYGLKYQHNWKHYSGNIYVATPVVALADPAFIGGDDRLMKSSMGDLTANHDWYGNWDSMYVYLSNPSDTSNIRVMAINIAFQARKNNYLQFNDLRIVGVGTGVFFSGSIGSKVSNCEIDSSTVAGVLVGDKSSECIIDSLTITNSLDDAMYFSNGADNIEVSNCKMINSGISTYPGDRETIGVWNSAYGVSTGNINIHNCYIEQNVGGYCIEMCAELKPGWEQRNGTISLYNNIIKYYGEKAIISAWQGNYIIHNNLIVGNGVSGSNRRGIWTGEDLLVQPCTANICNNTFVNTTVGVNIYEDGSSYGSNKFVVKNNIMYGTTDYFIEVSEALCDSTIINNNLYYSNAGAIFKWGANKYNYSEWKKVSGQDVNSTYGVDPLFVGSSDFSLKPGSPAINSGTYVGFSKDIIGNPIVGNPDIGAYEHPFVVTKIKAFLEGAYKNGVMTTILNSSNFIPTKQPYNIAPWNYAGTESVTSIPSSIVDWVLVELRTDINSRSIIARRAAFLKNDGSIVDLDGKSSLKFDFIPKDKYYLVVMHRNHLAVMSSKPIMISDSSSLYNFSDSMSKAYGVNPMTDLNNGIYGMYAGDGEANGGVGSRDRNNVWRVEEGKTGYLQGDYNLDGLVNNNDLDLYWRTSNGNLTQVPH